MLGDGVSGDYFLKNFALYILMSFLLSVVGFPLCGKPDHVK